MVPEKTLSQRKAYGALIRILDSLSEEEAWIEKTTQNIFCIRFIERYLPNALFIHIVSNGRENVASLYDAGQRYNDFKGRFGGTKGLLKAVCYWNRALEISHRHIRRKRHLVFRYEDLIWAPERILRIACEFCGLEYRQAMLSYDANAAFIMKHETWKTQQPNKITRKASRFLTLSPKDRTFVTNNIYNVDVMVPRNAGIAEQRSHTPGD